MMGGAAPATTDLILGIVTLTCAGALLRAPGVDRSWHLTFWFAGAGALAGAAHHGVFHTETSWTVVGVLVVLAISALLTGSARETLSLRRLRVIVGVRALGVVAYAVAVVLGEGGLRVLLLCESVTMACILGLWLHALHVGHHMAVGMIAAILVHGLAGIAFALPATVTAPVGLGPTSLSHLAQIPGVLVLYRAVVRGTRARRARRARAVTA